MTELDKALQELKAEVQRLRKSNAMLEEELLLRLPCEVGDTVYRPVPKLYRTCTKMIVSEIIIKEDEILFKSNNGTTWCLNAIGKTVFLTKEEVEARLKELEEEAR